MTDRQFLIWIRARLVQVHGESPFVDYISKLENIILTIPVGQRTPNAGTVSLEDMEGKS